ncbi:MAG: short-chain dehydrogenase [Oceanicaulis sp.]|nr:short-chain dehydrogenase [Oceanicaulis sp.]MAZ91588.1 short-chain dehydrogenase [Maricaulis sp.]MBI75899.1 short-chain dehydrogenase [Oceanicaulis sp.]
MKIEGCTAIVTGGNRGIGLGFVEELLDHGAARVYVGARKRADAEDVAKTDPARIVPVELDVTRPDQVAAAADKARDVTLVVNNAGAFEMQRLYGTDDPDAARREMEVNYFGVLSMSRAFAPVIAANGGGGIINVLSAGGIVAVPDMGGYSPSKFAARAASDCLRAELAPLGVGVTALIVGSVDTRMAAHVKVKKSQPRDIGKAGLWAIANGVAEHDTDPHSIAVRAHLARDPHGLAKSMADRMAPKT